MDYETVVKEDDSLEKVTKSHKGRTKWRKRSNNKSSF